MSRKTPDWDAEFQVISTEDGSPTMVWRESGEPMHNRKGAFSESLFIYDPVLRKLGESKSLKDSCFLSVGMGLGYNEMILAARTLGQNPEEESIHPKLLVSSEKSQALTQELVSWLGTSDPDSPFEKTLSFVASALNCNERALRQQLQYWKQQNRWIMVGPIEELNLSQKTAFHGIFFDAFSAKTSPELWTEAFLEKFFRRWTASEAPCCVATYAATGALIRSLKANNFEVTKRSGFAGKRESTWAEKNTSIRNIEFCSH